MNFRSIMDDVEKTKGTVCFFDYLKSLVGRVIVRCERFNLDDKPCSRTDILWA